MSLHPITDHIVKEISEPEALWSYADIMRLIQHAQKLERELAESELALAKSEFSYDQLTNYVTAKLGTKGEHSVFETIDNVVARLAKLEAENQQRKQDCMAAVQSVLEARDLLSPGTNLSLKEAVEAWRKAASPVTAPIANPDAMAGFSARTGSALALDAQRAIKKGDPIGSYDAYAEWLASHERGYLYLKQAISALAWQLNKTGNLPMMRQAVDEVSGAERALVDEKVKAPNDQDQATWI